MSGLSLCAMAVLLWSTRNCVCGAASSSGFQSSSGSRWIFSNRLAGFSGAPRCAEMSCSACTKPLYHTAQEALLRRFNHELDKTALVQRNGQVHSFGIVKILHLENITATAAVWAPGLQGFFAPLLVRDCDEGQSVSVR